MAELISVLSVLDTGEMMVTVGNLAPVAQTMGVKNGTTLPRKQGAPERNFKERNSRADCYPIDR